MTEAYLPPKLIINACEKTLNEIKETRNNILVKLADERFRKWWWRFRQPSLPDLMIMTGELPEGDKEIARLHRSEDENTVIKILNLSQGAIATDEDLRVQVSIDDFSIIYEHYEVKERR